MQVLGSEIFNHFLLVRTHTRQYQDTDQCEKLKQTMKAVVNEWDDKFALNFIDNMIFVNMPPLPLDGDQNEW
jgi:hypothetical protein